VSWGIALALALGVVSIALAFVIRGGRSRAFYAEYQTNAPPWIRNRVFSLLPGGIALITGAGGVGANRDRGNVGAVLWVATLAAVVLLFVWVFRPPEFMKPAWLRAVESGAAPEPADLCAWPISNRSRFHGLRGATGA